MRQIRQNPVLREVRYTPKVLPGGRNSGQKAQKGPGKIKIRPKDVAAEFWPNFTKSGRGGPEKIF
jgi:hypothetical protein